MLTFVWKCYIIHTRFVWNPMHNIQFNYRRMFAKILSHNLSQYVSERSVQLAPLQWNFKFFIIQEFTSFLRLFLGRKLRIHGSLNFFKNSIFIKGGGGAKCTFTQHLHHRKNTNKKNQTHHILRLFCSSEMHQK